MRHTKGPWREKNSEVFAKGGEGICVPYGIANNDKANAILISNAPSMLKMLKRLSKISTMDLAWDAEILRLIEKAEGKK